jgi:hypothetical protein
MRIEYEVTLDELATTNTLWLKGTGTFEKWRAWGVLYWLLAMAVIVYLGEGMLIGKILVGFILGGFLAYRMVFHPEILIKKKIKKTLKSKLKDSLPIPASIEILENKITYKTEDSTVEQKLDAIESIENEEEGILLTFSNKTIIYIPFVAFKNNEIRQQWECRLNESHA